MSFLELLSWMVAAVAGAIAHELAHYLVWVATGREPLFDVRELEVLPTAGPEHGTRTDRIAAGAPYLCGALAVFVGVWNLSAVVVIFGLAMVQLPSAADVAAMRGDVRWRPLVE